MHQVFTKTDTTFYKGIGILLIVFHNFFHTPKQFGLENEEWFNPENVHLFLGFFSEFNLTNWISAIFGFLGHYGVQLFILFSAYGLTVQFSRKTTSTLKFVTHRLKKIYFLLFFGIVVNIFIYWAQGQPLSLYDILKKSFLLGTTASSFTNWYLYGMFAGPFWFFALIIQLYVLFPFFYKLITSFDLKKIWIPFVGAYILIYPLHYLTADNHFSLFGNVFGHLPEVFLGIAMAHFQFKSFKKIILLVAAAVFILSQFFEIFFPLSFLMVTVLLLGMVGFLRKNTKGNFEKFILFTGEISMILFIVNGRFRFSNIFSDFSLVQFSYYLPLLFGLSYILYLIYNYLQRNLLFRSSRSVK